MQAQCVYPVAAELGEGPIWSAREQALWFVDIKGHRIHRYQVGGGEHYSYSTPLPIGFLAPVAGGGFLCGLSTGLHRFDPQTGLFTLVARVDSNRPRNRLNDGHVDAVGRLWFGTMDDEHMRPTGALYRFDARGLLCCSEGYVISNGPATSPDGRTLYHVDTARRQIHAFDLNPSGVLSNSRVFARIEAPHVYPDGLAVDASGCVWVALYGGWGVSRYSPAGTLLATLELPVAHCTKPAFGDADLRTLYITTAWQGLTTEERSRQPLAGGLFSTRVETPGLPQNEVRVPL